jgi:hypothetical protein
MGAADKTLRSPTAAPRLFGPDEVLFKPVGRARLVALARMARSGSSPSGGKKEENRRMMRQLRAWGGDLGRRFGLEYRSLEPEREGVNGHFGVCYEDGVIRIRLRHATTGRLLKESSLVDTLCHELAHLRYLDHSLKFRKLYEEILATARRLGYYRPGPLQPSGPRQLALFEK